MQFMPKLSFEEACKWRREWIMSVSNWEISARRGHMKGRRAIRALAAFNFIISLLLIAFDSVSLGFGVSNERVIPVNRECQLSNCYTGAGLWSGVSGLIASIFGLIALRRCQASKTRHGIYFILCLFASICNAVAFLLAWTCDTSLFDCLRYHQENTNTEKSLKIMAIMYSCLLLEVFVHMVSSNASIGFALYNCCLNDPLNCESCRSQIRHPGHEQMDTSSILIANNFELPPRSKARMLTQDDFPKSNYTQSLPRYVVLSRGPTNV